MYVVVKHQISDPARFWAAADPAAGNLPAGTTLHAILPNTDGSEAVCLWESDSLDNVKNLVESTVGAASQNDYYEVDSDKALGLPRSA